MAYRHGVYKSEVPTGLVPPAPSETGLPVIVGTAPLHLGSDEEALTNVNKPKLVYNYAEAVAQFGYSDDWEKYTLSEFIYSQFALFAMSPCVLINVLDPTKHKETVPPALYTIKEGEVDLGQDVILANGLTSRRARPMWRARITPLATIRTATPFSRCLRVVRSTAFPVSK